MKALRRLALALLLILGAIAALIWFVDSDYGHQLIERQIETQAPKNGLRIRIGRIEGSIFNDTVIHDLELLDPQGRFFAAPEVALDWRPASWLSNRLDIRSLTAERATLSRLPKFLPTERTGPILPAFDILVGKFDIRRLDIGKGVAGEARTGSLSGKADIRNGRAMVNLVADADRGDRLALVLDAEPDRDRFDMEARLNAPSGGVFGAMLGTQKPVAATISGDGSWKAWRGKLAASFEGATVADLALTSREGEFDLNGRLMLASFTKGKVQRLAGPVTRVSGKARLERRRLGGALRLGSDALNINLSGVADLGQNRFDPLNIDAMLLQPAALFPNMAGRDIRLKAMLSGAFSTPQFDYLLTSPDVRFDRTGFVDVRASGQGRITKAPVAVPVRLTARQVTGVGDVAGGILANLTAEGVLNVTAKAIVGNGILVRSDKFNGRVNLLIDLATGRYDIGLTGGLQRYEIPGIGLVDVKTELSVQPGPDGRGTQIAGRGQAWVRRLDNGFFAGLTRGLPVIDTGLVRGPDGILYLKGLKLRSPGLAIDGNGYRRVDGSFFFEGSGRQAQYGTFRIRLDGPIERPKVDLVFDRPLAAAELAGVKLSLVPSAQGFAWTASGGSLAGAFNGNGQILLPRGQAAVIEIAKLTASGITATGRVTAVPGGLNGSVRLSGGGVEGTLGLGVRGGVQAIAANLTARDARLDGNPPIVIRRGRFEGVILLNPKGVQVDGTVSAQGLSRGNLSLARLAANLKMDGDRSEVRASFAGSRGKNFDLQTVASGGNGVWRIVGSGTIDRRPISITDAAVIRRDGQGWRLEPARIAFGGGTAQLAGRFGNGRTELTTELRQMPLAIADIVSPGLGLGGIANGRIAFTMADGAMPNGTAELRIKGLTRSGLVLSSAPLDMGISAAVSGNNAGLRAVAVSGGKTIGRAQVQFTPGPGSTTAQRFTTAALRGQIRYSGNADTLWRLTGVEIIDISGPVELGADVSGRVDNPQIRGSIKTQNARIESAVTGMVLSQVAASGRFDSGSRLTLDSFSARTGSDGQVSGRGEFNLASAAGFGIDLSIQAENARLLARDDLGATVTGPIRIKSDGGGGVISGELDLKRSFFRLGRATAAQAVPQLKVREINPKADRALPPPPSLPWKLAIKARAPNRMMVTGMGIESEWRGDLDISGTATAPAIRGRVDLVRGEYEFAGKTFDLTRGAIRFQGEVPADPVLDIVAEGEEQAIKAKILVGGTGQRPEIRFTSVPSLPEDELLSRLLFGTSITNLSAPEAVQLAAAVASLQGGGGTDLNPLNALRRAIGLDRLRILPADTATGQSTSIAIGKYLTRRTYVEVVTDGQGYSATKAEFQITRWLSILSTISTLGRQSAAVRVSKDY